MGTLIEIIDLIFTWGTLIFVIPNIMLIFRSLYVYFIHRRIRKRISQIARSTLIESAHVEPFYNSLQSAYWDWDKMMKHWWVFDINKMRN